MAGMRAALLAVLLALSFAVSAGAQVPKTNQDTQSGWEIVEQRAEAILSDEEASTARLSALRDTLADWRTRLLAAEGANSNRIETIQSALDGLGPAPDTDAGETEPEEIAKRRDELQKELAEAQAPGLKARAAYNRADGLISEIDARIRERQNEALLEVGPTPLNPENWKASLTSMAKLWASLGGEVQRNLTTDWRRSEILRGLPLAIVAALAGIVMLFRGRVWMARLSEWVQRRHARRGAITTSFLMSLLQIIVPFVGVSLLQTSILSLDVFGPKGEALVRALTPIVLGALGALWLAGRLFPEGEDIPAAFAVDQKHRERARRRALGVGLLVGAASLLRTLSSFDEIGPDALSVYGFTIYLGLSLSFIGLSRVLRSAYEHQTEETEGAGLGLRALSYLARALVLVGLAGPLVALAGYHNLADAIMLPSALTLAIIGLLVALQAPIRDAYAWVTRTELEKAGEALFPVLINVFLVLGAIPLLALAWGMRVAELTELFQRVNEGISIGDVRLTPGDILAVILVFAIGLAIVRLLQGVLRTTVLPRTKMDQGAQNALVSVLGYVGVALVSLIAINAGGIDLTALAVVLGALSVGLGFGLQNIVQNFVAGIILLIERPISEGDWIEVAGNMGIVKRISVRSTTIETFDKQQLIVPNADFISGTVTNWTRGNQTGRALVSVGVAYGTDTRMVEKILLEIAQENPHVAAFPEPGVDFMGFGADSLDFRIRAILYDVNMLLPVKSEIHHRIAERFAEEGIEIPFAQRDIWLRNPELLPGGKPTPEPERPEPREEDPDDDASETKRPLTPEGAAEQDGAVDPDAAPDE